MVQGAAIASSAIGFHSGSPAGRAYKVGYDRPINTRFGNSPRQPENYLFDSEYATIRWPPANGCDVSYFGSTSATGPA